jgi:hypothetical protein
MRRNSLWPRLAVVFAATSSLALAGVVSQDRASLVPKKPTIDPPLAETRLSVHTILREDSFAGFLANDEKRAQRARKNRDILFQQRPDQKGNLLAWKAGDLLYQAVLAHEAKKPDEFRRLFKESQEHFALAAEEKTGNDGVYPIWGGTFVIFGDRLPEEEKALGWKQAYDAYQALWKLQGSIVESLPPHFSGELLAGLATSAQRTGHKKEADEYLDKILKTLPGTPYETAAKRWIKDPGSVATTGLGCVSCHEGGRLEPKLSALEKQ